MTSVVVCVVLLSPVAASAAEASTGPSPGSDRAAAVQAVLDRVLGPGHATVVVSDTIRTSTDRRTSLQWGTGAVAARSTSSQVVAGFGSTRASSRQDAVGGTATDVVTPAGALVRQDVAVAVDRAHLGGVSVVSLRRIVRAAAGIVRARGDRLTVVVTRFVRPVAAPAPVPAMDPLTPYRTPALAALAAVVAMLVGRSALRRARRGRAGVDGA